MLAIFSGLSFPQPLTQNLPLKASFQKDGALRLFKPVIRTRCCHALYLDIRFQHLPWKNSPKGQKKLYPKMQLLHIVFLIPSH